MTSPSDGQPEAGDHTVFSRRADDAPPVDGGAVSQPPGSGRPPGILDTHPGRIRLIALAALVIGLVVMFLPSLLEVNQQVARTACSIGGGLLAGAAAGALIGTTRWAANQRQRRRESAVGRIEYPSQENQPRG